VFCWLVLVSYLKRLQHKSVHRTQYGVIPQCCLLKTIHHPSLAQHTEPTNKEIGHRASHSCRSPRETLVQSGPLEMEIGFRLDRRAAMYSMLLFRPRIRALFLLGSHPMAALVVRFIDQVTVAIYGQRCWL